MANTQKVKLSGSFVDGDGVRSAARAYALVDPTSTLTEALAMLTGYLNAVAGCSDAGLSAASMSIEDGSAPVGVVPASADSTVDETGVLDFNIPASTRTYGFAFPAVKDSIIVAEKIDTATGPGSTLAALLTGGATGITYTDENYLALGALVQTFRSARKHRRGLKHASLNKV